MRKPFGAAEDEGVEVILSNQYGKRRYLAEVQGIQKCSVVKRGHTMTVTIVSDLGMVYEPGWEIRAAGRRARPTAKPSPR